MWITNGIEISAIAIPARVARRAARGVTRLIQEPTTAPESSSRPLAKLAARQICQARIAASVSPSCCLLADHTGPIIRKTKAYIEGVLIP